MKVIITGAKDVKNYDILKSFLNRLNLYITEVICGTSSGVETLGIKWAKENGIPVKYFPPDHGRYGKVAESVRNKEIALYANIAIIIRHINHNNLDIIKQMNHLNKPYFELIVKDK